MKKPPNPPKPPRRSADTPHRFTEPPVSGADVPPKRDQWSRLDLAFDVVQAIIQFSQTNPRELPVAVLVPVGASETVRALDLAALSEEERPANAMEMPAWQWRMVCDFWKQVTTHCPFQESPELDTSLVLISLEMHLVSVAHQRFEHMGLPHVVEEMFGIPFQQLTASRLYPELIMGILSAALWEQLRSRQSRIVTVSSVPHVTGG
jgi:hypothetical protein